MRFTSQRIFVSTLAAALLGAGCGSTEITIPQDPDFEGVFDFDGIALTDLSDQCAYDTGAITLTLDSGDIGVMGRNAAGEVTINGVACGDATVSNIRTITIEEGTAGAQTLVLDFLAGQFSNGRTTGAGWIIDLGTGDDNLRLRGTTGVDRYTMGDTGLATNSDANVDVTYANIESVVVSLGPGNDIFSAGGNAAAGTALTASVAVYGGAGNDSLRGGAGDDDLFGGDGNDTFLGGTEDDGSDEYDGGAGTDTADYSARTASITVTIDDVADDGETGENDDVQVTVENVIGGTVDDSLTGSDEANVLTGGAGADTLSGGDGADTLNGGLGNDIFDCGTSTDGADVMVGGAGTDTVDYSARTGTLTISLNGQADDGEEDELDNVRADVENVYGGDGGDTIVGSASANILEGGAGDDTVSGGGGNDTMRGDAGDDTLNGDAGDDIFDCGTSTDGADVLNGGAGVDEADYSARTASGTITIGAGADDGGLSEGDDIGATVENILGGDGDDVITGSDSDNVIDGGAGADTIDGGAGNDTLSGGLGNDDLDGGDGEDSIDGDGGTDTLACGAGDGDVCLDSADCGSATACEL